jgi:hypothetical protein
VGGAAFRDAACSRRKATQLAATAGQAHSGHWNKSLGLAVLRLRLLVVTLKLSPLLAKIIWPTAASISSINFVNLDLIFVRSWPSE